MAHSLDRLIIGDEPTTWSAAGFTVTSSTVVLGKTVVELRGAHGPRGILGWALRGVDSDLDGLNTIAEPDHKAQPATPHPNCAFSIDHIVIESDDPARTARAFEAIGMSERKRTVIDVPDGTREQRFYWAGRVIVELVGPSRNPGTTFWGLAIATADLETACSTLAPHCGEPRDAVQAGRKIATVRTKELDISVPLAFMSPHVANLDP